MMQCLRIYLKMHFKQDDQILWHIGSAAESKPKRCMFELRQDYASSDQAHFSNGRIKLFNSQMYEQMTKYQVLSYTLI